MRLLPFALMLGIYSWARRCPRPAIFAATVVVATPMAYVLLTDPGRLFILDTVIVLFLPWRGHRTAILETERTGSPTGVGENA